MIEALSRVPWPVPAGPAEWTFESLVVVVFLYGMVMMFGGMYIRSLWSCPACPPHGHGPGPSPPEEPEPEWPGPKGPGGRLALPRPYEPDVEWLDAEINRLLEKEEAAGAR